MKIKNLFFHIHYCNYKQFIKSGRFSKIINKKLQHHELIFIKGEKGNIQIGNKRYQFKGGILLYVCPDVLHSIEVDIYGPGDFLSVHFSYANVSFNDGKWDVKSGLEILPLYPAQEFKDYYSIEDKFKKLIDSWNAKLPGYEFIARTLLQELLISVYQNTIRQDQNYSSSLKVEKVIQYMHQNINIRLTVTELSELVQLSSSYLSRIFKEITGYSIIEYFNKIKIDKAKEQLIEGDKKVKEVARTLGFIDEFYFSRIFKKLEGISPSEFYSRNIHEE